MYIYVCIYTGVGCRDLRRRPETQRPRRQSTGERAPPLPTRPPGAQESAVLLMPACPRQLTTAAPAYGNISIAIRALVNCCSGPH